MSPDSDPQAAESTPSTKSPDILNWFILAVVIVMLMDFWLNVEQGFGIAEAILRVFVPALMKAGR
jgi:hypothetical protein